MFHPTKNQVPICLLAAWVSSFFSFSLAPFQYQAGKKDKGAPDLSNESNFPSLSAAVAIEQNAYKLKKCDTTLEFWMIRYLKVLFLLNYRFDQQERGFIEQKPSRSQSSRSAGGDEGPRLHLGNKFYALSNEDN